MKKFDMTCHPPKTTKNANAKHFHHYHSRPQSPVTNQQGVEPCPHSRHCPASQRNWPKVCTHSHEGNPPRPVQMFWNPFTQHTDPGKRMMLKGRDGNEISVFMREEGEIGKGTFGSIKCVLVKAHGKPTEKLAMKVTMPGEEDLGIIEANIMLKLRHRNIVRLRYYYEVQGSIRLLMEMMEEGDLYHLIHQVWSPTRGLGIYCELFGFQIFRGLAYMHSLGIAHRDIKPENVLISRSTGLAKLTDFNCSTKMNDRREHSPRVGTKTYNAPELLLNSRLYNEKVDVWSAGVVMTAMITRRSIFLIGASGHPVEPLKCILDYLGSPTKDDFDRMLITDNDRMKCPSVKKNKSFFKALGYAPGISDKDEFMDLLPHVFTYKVNKRFTAYQVCSHSLFDFIRSGAGELENGYALPDVFSFSESQMLS